MTGSARPFSLGSYFATTLPPLDGRLRFIVVAVLLLLAWSSVFGSVPERITECPDGFYEAEGIMTIVGPSSQAQIAAWTARLQTPMLIAWCAAAIGLFGRWSLLFTGVCLTLTVGWWRGCVGTGHSWYLPVYTFLALGAAAGVDRFSVDALLAQKFAWYPFRPSLPGSVGASGLARSLVLLCVVFVMTSAGLSKLLDGGLQWMNGDTLQEYLRLSEVRREWGRWVYDLLVNSGPLCTAVSVFTFVIELGAVALLFSKKLRFPYVVAAWMFHLGIMAVMVPEYLPQMTCYLLIIDFGALVALLRRAPKKKKKKKRPLLSPRVGKISAAAGLAVSAVLLATVVVRREYYPLSYIPMYSSRMGSEVRGGLPLSEWQDPAAFQRIAQKFLQDHRPWVFQSHVGRQVQLVLKTARGRRQVTRPLLQRLLPSSRTVWVKRASWAVAHDLSARPPDSLIAHGPANVVDLTEPPGATHSEELLRLVLPTAQTMGMGQGGGELELVYVEQGFVLLLAKASL